jgi:hypothetical protein
MVQLIMCLESGPHRHHDHWLAFASLFQNFNPNASLGSPTTKKVIIENKRNMKGRDNDLNESECLASYLGSSIFRLYLSLLIYSIRCLQKNTRAIISLYHQQSASVNRKGGVAHEGKIFNNFL